MIQLWALVGIGLISLSPVCVAFAHASPATTAFFRCFYAVPVLALLWWRDRGSDHRPARARWLAFGSGVFLAVDLVCWHRSIELIGAGMATVLANTQVIFIVILSWLVYRERPKSSMMAVVPVVLLGVAFISGLGREDAYGAAPVMGAILGFGSGLLYTGFLLTFRRSNRILAPAAGPLLDATTGCMIASLALGALDPGFRLEPSWPSHGYLAALALGSQVFGWLFIATALPRLPALETSILLLAQPMLSLVLAASLLGERISPLQAAGILLVIGGLGYSTWRSSMARTAPAETCVVIEPEWNGGG